jgi:hypothetical protein
MQFMIQLILFLAICNISSLNAMSNQSTSSSQAKPTASLSATSMSASLNGATDPQELFRLMNMLSSYGNMDSYTAARNQQIRSMYILYQMSTSLRNDLDDAGITDEDIKNNTQKAQDHSQLVNLYQSVRENFENACNSGFKGLWTELKYRGRYAIGEVVETHVKTNADKTIGRGMDYIVDYILNIMSKFWQWAYHDSKKPFTIRLVQGWHNLVNGIFDDINRMLRDDLREKSRSCDTTMRHVDDSAQVKQQEQDNKIISIWRMLISCYMEEFDYLVMQLSKYKAYYDQDDITVFYATQIQKQLLRCRSLLTKAQSLHDLDTFVDSNKAMVDAVKNSLDNLFTRLAEQLDIDNGEPVITKKQTSTSSRNLNKYSDSFDDFAGSFGSKR